MININLSNIIGASISVQSELISTSTSSICLDFMSELKLEFENSGDISNKTEDDEEMMLYNSIYELYQKFNIQKEIVGSQKLELDNTLLDSNYIKEVIDYINNYIDEYKNTSDKEELNNQFNLLIDKIKERLESYEKSNNDVAIYDKLDGIGVFNMSKIVESDNSKNKDMDCLENILASDDNNYTNFVVGFNKFNTEYKTNVNVEIEQPVSEIRKEFISDEIVKAVKYIKSNDMESLNVKFNPKDLGEISINISKNNEESNLLITVDDDNIFDFVNNNIEYIKNHLKDSNVDIKDVLITIKSDNENLFSDNLNRGFNQESNFKQNKNNNPKKYNQEIIDDLTINDYKNDNENLNILI